MEGDAKKIIEPITHKLHYYTHFDSVDLYYSLINAWKDDNQIFKKFSLEGDNFIFSSKGGMSYRQIGEEQYRRNFEYTIKLESDDKIKKFYIAFKPELPNTFYGESKKFGDYQPYKLKKGEGVEVEVNGTYYSLEDSQELLKKIMNYLGLKKYWQYQNKDKARIRQMEFYLRYHEHKEKAIGQKLNDINEVVGLSSDEYTKITRKKENWAYSLFSIRTDRWHDLGFNNKGGNWRIGIKTYRTREWQSFGDTSALRHPKLEVYLDEEKVKEYPSLSDYEKLKQTMYDIIGNVAIWGNLDYNDFIEDNYFKPMTSNILNVKEKSNMIKKLRELNKCICGGIRKEISKSDSIRDYLNCLIKNEFASYNDIMKATHLKYDWVKQLTYKLEQKNIIKVIRSTENIIGFKSIQISKIIKAIVETINEFDTNPEKESSQRKSERRERQDKPKKKIHLKKELNDSEIKALISVGVINERNGGIYQLINFEYIRPEFRIKGEIKTPLTHRQKINICRNCKTMRCNSCFWMYGCYPTNYDGLKLNNIKSISAEYQERSERPQKMGM